MLLSPSLTLSFENFHDFHRVLFALKNLALLVALCDEDDDFALASSSCSSESLHHSDRRSQAIIRNNQIDIANIEAFLGHARSYQSVQIPLLE